MPDLTTGLLTTYIDPEMKTQYLGAVTQTINQKLILNSRLKPGNIYKVGKTWRLPYQIALSEGGEMFNYNGPLATPGASEYTYLEGTVKHRNLVVQVFGADADFTDTTEKAYVNAVTQEIKSKADAEQIEQERISFGDGGTSGIGKIAGASHSGGVVTVTLTTTYNGKNATKYIRRGMLIDFYAGTSLVTNGGGLRVTAKTGDTTFTIAGDATLASAIDGTKPAGTDNGLIFVKGGKGTEYLGLAAQIGSATNTLHNINRSTAGNEWYKPNVWYQTAAGPVRGEKQTTGNLDWNPNDLRTIIRDLQTSQGIDPSQLLIFCTPELEDYMVQQQINAGETVVRNQSVDNWPYKTVAFNGAPVLSAPLCWANCLFIAYPGSFMKMNCKDLDWTPFGQSYWTRVSGYDAYQAIGIERKENSIKEPMKCATLWNVKGIND